MDLLSNVSVFQSVSWSNTKHVWTCINEYVKVSSNESQLFLLQTIFAVRRVLTCIDINIILISFIKI